MFQLGSASAAFRAQSRSTLLHQRGSALADFLKCRFETTKFLRAQFRERSLHLQGVLSKGSGDELFAGRGKGDNPHAPVFGALDAADQALLHETVHCGLIERGVRSTIGPIVLTGKGPLCSSTSSTPKSERPSPVSSIPAAAYLVRVRIAFIITSQTWSVP